ncbi:MAG TPA: cysteine--tRNA ligase [Bryobacteraceae bacterium]|jgi:cysteinyl-tRNA synthetase|nr:cysteine--tRNA ligase [Bryobacteraceae bacterium]
MPLRFYNTLTQQVQPFQPIDPDVVRMYTCGPTVYDFAHIGNFRTFVFYDLLRRALRLNGYKLDHVMNITDVDDKIIRNAVAQGKGLKEYTDIYTKAFLDDCAVLRLERPERIARATDHIPEMAAAIAKLEREGHTYRSDGSVYFRIASFPEYGKLSHNDFSGMVAGARVDVDNYEKTDARDFALWKAAKPGEPSWDTEVGTGRPGWHIECSVMAIEFLGETLDIHAGGVDLIFPHHENEIAQSEALTHQPFAYYWLHSEFLLVDGQKMSKSLGNFYTLRDIFGHGFSPESVRFLLASVPYRRALNFTFEGLKSATTAIERLRNFQFRLDSAKLPSALGTKLEELAAKAQTDFRAALDDDLNTAEALAAVFEYVREANIALDADEFQEINRASARALLDKFDAFFDVLKPSAAAGGLSDEDIEKLIAERTAAKKARDFAKADQVRADLLAQGIILEDTKDGIRWKRK